MRYTQYNSSRRKKKNILLPTSKTIGILGIITLVLAVPATLLLTQNRTQTRSNATASTTLSFSQPNPQVNTNDTLSMDVTLDPGQNAVSFVKLVIAYDNSQVQPTATGIVPNSTAFPPPVLDGPTYNTCVGTQCTMSVQLGTGANPTSAITTPGTKVATVNFSVIGSNSQTTISFDSQTQVLSVAPSDSPNENVLANSSPSTVTIGNISNFTPSPTSAQTLTPVPTCDPTLGINCPNPSITGSVTLTPAPTCDPTLGLNCANPSPTGACDPTVDPSCSGTSPTTEPSSGPTVTPIPTPGQICLPFPPGVDDIVQQEIAKSHQVIDKMEQLVRAVAKDKHFTKAEKKKFTQRMSSDLDKVEQDLEKAQQVILTPPPSNGKGGCLGAFDPNNPASGQNCDSTPTVGAPSWWNAFTQFLQNFFSNNSNNSNSTPTPTP